MRPMREAGYNQKNTNICEQTNAKKYVLEK